MMTSFGSVGGYVVSGASAAGASARGPTVALTVPGSWPASLASAAKAGISWVGAVSGVSVTVRARPALIRVSSNRSAARGPAGHAPTGAAGSAMGARADAPPRPRPASGRYRHWRASSGRWAARPRRRQPACGLPGRDPRPPAAAGTGAAS